MEPIQNLTSLEARRLRGLLFDLDDTLLDHGCLGEKAYSALFRLRESGLELYVVTGRPVSWAELLVRLFPVQGAVAENGSLGVIARGTSVEIIDPVPPKGRAARTLALAAAARELTETFPDLIPAGDVSGRLADFTFDIGETRKVPEARVSEVRAWARTKNLATLTSSVHLHIGFDRADKASGAVRFLRTLSGVDVTRALCEYAYIGDSENDAACFAAFRTTIGVANLRGRLTVLPRFVTRGARGQGFAEAAEVLCSLRSSGDKDPA